MRGMSRLLTAIPLLADALFAAVYCWLATSGPFGFPDERELPADHYSVTMASVLPISLEVVAIVVCALTVISVWRYRISGVIGRRVALILVVVSIIANLVFFVGISISGFIGFGLIALVAATGLGVGLLLARRDAQSQGCMGAS